MKIFKFEAEGDSVFIEETNIQSAHQRFEKFMGILPESMLTVSEVKELPDGEELL